MIKNTVPLNVLRAMAAPEGREILVVGANCWGRDQSADKAYKICRENFSRPMSHPNRKPSLFVFYQVAPEAFVDDFGYITYDGGEDAAPVKIAEYRTLR